MRERARPPQPGENEEWLAVRGGRKSRHRHQALGQPAELPLLRERAAVVPGRRLTLERRERCGGVQSS